jgi:methylmalonyl-CoA mutase N-terminal domain/subunit
MREAGATAAQEVGFTLANALEYVGVGLRAGLAVDAFGPRLSFFFAAHNNLFEEAAKFRAARRLWARLVRERFDANDQTARLRFHTQTGGVTLQAQQPSITSSGSRAGLVRRARRHPIAAYQRLDEAPRSQRRKRPLALRTQQVIGHETGVADVIDPLAESYVEARDRIEQEARTHRGGGCAARGGRVARATRRRRSRGARGRSSAPESGEQVVVGVNRFVEQVRRRRSPCRISRNWRAGSGMPGSPGASRDSARVATLDAFFARPQAEPSR